MVWIYPELLLPALCFAMFATTHGENAARTVVQQKLAIANNEFAFELYRTICRSADGGNVFLSPASIAIALAMVNAGARGDTRAQLAKVMRLDAYDSDLVINEDFKKLVETLNSPSKNYTLNAANRIFATTEHEYRAEFLRLTLDHFLAELESMNFRDDPSGSRRAINEWVASKTANKIENLLPEGSITETTALVLVNAIYFKALWLNQFDKSETLLKQFRSPGKSTEIEMMTMAVNEFNYYDSKELQCEVLELPYAGEEVSMLVFLPRETEGLAAVEEALRSDTLGHVFTSLTPKQVKVSMPKFALTQGVALKQFLQLLGVEDLFDVAKADLSGIESSKSLVVTEVMHKAFIAVDEEGTEAAGSSAVIVKIKSARPNYINFFVDRPFLFAIVEKSTGSLLFLGRFVVPPNEAPSEDIGEFGKIGARICCAGNSLRSLWIHFELSFIAIAAFRLW